MFEQAVLFLLIISVNYSFETVIEASYNVNIECGSNQIITINDAYWVSPDVDRTLWDQLTDIILPSKNNQYCLYSKKSEVRDRCHGKRKCDFIVNKLPPGQDCTFVEKLLVDYNCHNCQTRYSRVRVWKN